jgi:hypothetical protein
VAPSQTSLSMATVAPLSEPVPSAPPCCRSPPPQSLRPSCAPPLPPTTEKTNARAAKNAPKLAGGGSARVPDENDKDPPVKLVYRVSSRRGAPAHPDIRLKDMIAEWARKCPSSGNRAVNRSMMSGTGLDDPKQWERERWTGVHDVTFARERIKEGKVEEVVLQGDTSLGVNPPGIHTLLSSVPKAHFTILRTGLPNCRFRQPAPPLPARGLGQPHWRS